MTALKLVMTTAGLARFTAAQGSEDIDLTIGQVGFTAAAFAPAPTLTALPGEFRRVTSVSGEVVGDGVVHMTVEDAEPVIYQIRGFGLFLADGTLFATYAQETPIAEKAAGATFALAFDIAFPVAGVDRLTFGPTSFLNPPATTTTAGVIRIATQEEVDQGTSTSRAVTPSRLRSRLAKLAPIGMIVLFSGEAAPAGWAICNGQTVDRSDGAGTITTPDLRNRVAVGASPEHALGTLFGATNAETSAVAAGQELTTTIKTTYAGNGTQAGVEAASISNPTHKHSVDVTQPSIALHYIMRA